MQQSKTISAIGLLVCLSTGQLKIPSGAARFNDHNNAAVLGCPGGADKQQQTLPITVLLGVKTRKPGDPS